MTDERDENNQKDEADTLLGCYISYSNRTKLLFYRHYKFKIQIYDLKYSFQAFLSQVLCL